MKQGGTAEVRLSPLIGVEAFFISSDQSRGGGCVESDLVDLGEKEINLIMKQKTDHRRLPSGSDMIPPIGEDV